MVAYSSHWKRTMMLKGGRMKNQKHYIFDNKAICSTLKDNKLEFNNFAINDDFKNYIN